MALLDSLVVFLVSFLVGVAGIYVGGRIVTNTDSVAKAAVTALVGAAVWAVVAFLFGWIPLLGPLLALVAYVGVVNWQYPAGWASAAGVAFVAWIVSVALLYVLALLGVVTFGALGVPGV